MCDKTINIAKNQKHDEYERGLVSSFYRSFYKNSTATCANKFILFANKSAVNNLDGAIEIEGLSNQQSAVELHKLIVRKFEKRKVYASLKEYIWRVDQADMQLLSKYSEGIPLIV